MASILTAPFELLHRGGFMMYPLALSGLAALAISIERVWLLRFRLWLPDTALRSLLKPGAIEANLKDGSVLQPAIAVLKAGWENAKAPRELCELAMQNEAERWLPLIEKNLEVLDTIITAAPLMGLLGTITGMMASFQILSEKGVNEPGAITGGVAEALIATATGLVIALLTLVVYNYLQRLARDLTSQIERASSELIELIAKERT